MMPSKSSFLKYPNTVLKKKNKLSSSFSKNHKKASNSSTNFSSAQITPKARDDAKYILHDSRYTAESSTKN